MCVGRACCVYPGRGWQGRLLSRIGLLDSTGPLWVNRVQLQNASSNGRQELGMKLFIPDDVHIRHIAVFDVSATGLSRMGRF